MAEGKKRRYCKNTVPGDKHRGKWDEQTKTAAICAMLVSNNICEVARRYGVPESTLRTWMKGATAMGREEQKSLFAQAREREIRNMMHTAAAGAGATVRLMVVRMDRAQADEQRYRELCGQLEKSEDPEERKELWRKMELHTPMSDKAIADYARTMVDITGKAGELLGESNEVSEIRVVYENE